MKKYLFIVLSLMVVIIVAGCDNRIDPSFNPIRNEHPDGSGGEEEEGPDIDIDEWTLFKAFEFDGENAGLDEEWDFQNYAQGHILCSRWRENVTCSEGTLKILNKKETKAGQEWTSGAMWTKETYQYGYYECRYKYSAAHATNNSFWFMNGTATDGFEIDVNEGHYPNEISTNIHLREGGVTERSPMAFIYGVRPDYSIQLESPVTTNKIRFVSKNVLHFHIREFRIYGVNANGYPSNILSNTADTDVPGLVNYASNASITVSGSHASSGPVMNMVDGNVNSSWISQIDGEKWIEFQLASSVQIGCIQFVNGWLDANQEWQAMISDYKVQYHNGSAWVDISAMNVEDNVNFAEEFHTYGLEWNENELIFYFDRKIIRRIPNVYCKGPANIWLSVAIISWSGPITDDIDGTQMEVDYVRVYKKE